MKKIGNKKDGLFSRGQRKKFHKNLSNRNLQTSRKSENGNFLGNSSGTKKLKKSLVANKKKSNQRPIGKTSRGREYSELREFENKALKLDSEMAHEQDDSKTISIEVYGEKHDRPKGVKPLYVLDLKKSLGVKLVDEESLIKMFNKFIIRANRLNEEINNLDDYNSKQTLRNRSNRISKLILDLSALKTKILARAKYLDRAAEKIVQEFKPTLFLAIIRELQEKEYVSKQTRRALETLQEVFQAKIRWNIVELDAYVRWLVGAIDSTQDVKSMIAEKATEEYQDFLDLEQELSIVKEFTSEVREMVKVLGLDSLKKEWRKENKNIAKIIETKRSVNIVEVQESIERKMNRILDLLKEQDNLS